MFLNIMLVSFHGIMEVLVIGIGGYLIIAGMKSNVGYMEFLTRLVMRFTLPALVFSNLSTNFHPGDLNFWWAYPLLAVASNLAGALLGWIWASADRGVTNRGEFIALIAFQNGLFLPLALAPVLFGPDRLPTFMNLFFLYHFLSVPTFFTLAVWLVNSQANFTERIRGIINPPNVATVLGILFAFTGWGAAIPEWILRPMSAFGSLTTPLSTIFVGGVIVTTLSKARVGDWSEPVKVTLLKCLIFPGLAALLVWIVHPPEWVALFIIMQSVMPSALMIALITPRDQVKQRVVAAGILLTSLVSILTVPLFMGIFGALYW